jgi:hypothetical protein
MTSRRRKETDGRSTLEERLGPDVIKRLEGMAGEFVRFERGQFGFFIDPARYAVKQRQVGPLGRGRRRKVVAGVDKDGNVITAWIGVDGKGKGTKTGTGETVNIPDGYADGAATGPGGRAKGKGGNGSGGGGGGGGGEDGEGGEGDGADGAGGNGTGTAGGKGPGGNGGAGTRAPGEQKSAIEMARDAASKSGGGAAGASGVGGSKGVDLSVPALPKLPAVNLDAKDNEARGRQKKPLHWAKVPNNLLAGTVWTQLDDRRIVLNEENIDDLFGVDSKPAFAIAAEEVKPEVLPHKRKHNINILLANLKMTPDNIKDIIRVPTYKNLEVNTLQAVLLVCPNAEEEQLLIANENIRDQVDKTDAFMMGLADLRGRSRVSYSQHGYLLYDSDRGHELNKAAAYVGGNSCVRQLFELGNWSWRCARFQD